MDTRRRAFLAGISATAAGAIVAVTAGSAKLFAADDPAAAGPAAAPPAPAVAAASAAPAAPTVPATVAAQAAPPPGMSAARAALPRWQRFAVTPPQTDGRPAICIVIDDLGVMRRGTDRALALPAPLTLSWFPFARHLDEQVAAGSAAGHENTMHMPMQAFSNSIAQTGPNPLRIDLPPAENLARLRAAIAAVPNTVGLNNHMGSVATRDAALMDIVASEAHANDMLFLDSLVVSHSVAAKRSEAAGVPTAARDIFIDDKANRGLIDIQLDLIEKHATKYGHVIAIGHPRPLTLDALEAWMPTLKDKGFVLWPLAATVAWRNNITLPPLNI